MLSVERRADRRFAPAQDLTTVADRAFTCRLSRVWPGRSRAVVEEAMDTSVVIVEIRAAEGGDDAKLLVEEQLAIYVKLGARRGL